MFKEELTRSTGDADAVAGGMQMRRQRSKPRPPVVTGSRILTILAKQGFAADQVTYTEIERALQEYRRSHPDATFAPELSRILAYSDFALRNRALFHQKWNEAKLRAINPKQWQDLARQFQDLLAREAEGLRSLEYKERLMIYGNHLDCHWTSNRDDEASLGFDVLAAAAGQHLGASPEIQQAILQTNVGSWADFWKYCLWFYLGNTSSSTIAEPLKTSVKFCLHLALHSECVEEQRDAKIGTGKMAKAESLNAAKSLIQKFLIRARSTVFAARESLKSRSQTLDQAAATLELEARTWAQELHAALLGIAALEGLPPEQFEKQAAVSAGEIAIMAAKEFSVRRGADTTNGVTPFLIGRRSAVVTSDRPPEINTWGSIVLYLNKELARYPQEYRRDNLSVYKLNRGAESVDLPTLTQTRAEVVAPSPPKHAPPAGARIRVPLHDELKQAESHTADPKLRNKLVAVLRYNRYFEDLKTLKTSCKQYQTPALLQQEFPDLDVWAALQDADRPDIASGKFDPGRFAWSLVMRFLKLSGNDDRTLKNYRKSLKDAGLL